MTADVVATVRELGPAVEPEDATRLLRCHDETVNGRGGASHGRATKRFLMMESTPGEDAVKTVEVTAEI